MKKAYLTGAILSGLIHVPLLKEKEYSAFIVATLAWPVTFTVWTFYIRYLTWGHYQHRQMIKNKLGPYQEIVLDK